MFPISFHFIGKFYMSRLHLPLLLSDQSLYRIGMRLLTVVEAGWRVLRLFAQVRCVLPNEFCIRMFWLMVK